MLPLAIWKVTSVWLIKDSIYQPHHQPLSPQSGTSGLYSPLSIDMRGDLENGFSMKSLVSRRGSGSFVGLIS